MKNPLFEAKISTQSGFVWRRVEMGSVSLLPSGRFRGNAQVRNMRETSTFDRQATALAWVQRTEERMRAGTWSKAAVLPPEERRITVQQAFEQYTESEEWLAKREVTRKVEANKQKPVIAVLGARVLSELTSDDIRDYIAKRRKDKPQRSIAGADKLSGDSIRLEVAALSAACNYGIERKWISSNPCRGVKRPRGNERKVRIPDELLGAIFDHDAIRSDWFAFVFFRMLFSTAARPGELASARREWLRHDPPQILLPRTKNDDARAIILTDQIFKWLVELMEIQHGCPYLIGTLSRDRKGWSPYNYATPWRKVRRDLGLRALGVVPHAARHEAISRLFERTNLSDGQIAGLSGHRSAQALYRYKHLRNEHQRPIINALDKAIEDALYRLIDPSHPYRKLKPGEFMQPIVEGQPVTTASNAAHEFALGDVTEATRQTRDAKGGGRK